MQGWAERRRAQHVGNGASSMTLTLRERRWPGAGVHLILIAGWLGSAGSF
jgi:hypothetical protein